MISFCLAFICWLLIVANWRMAKIYKSVKLYDARLKSIEDKAYIHMRGTVELCEKLDALLKSELN
jgi:hypothetical protein